mmetsp:Transcript_26391/g.65625  ORF Transcript_26391/g.65625 Transcript_26391/m.65625 type:complete len:84 (-) Transcript_26391:1504-1755(-)
MDVVSEVTDSVCMVPACACVPFIVCEYHFATVSHTDGLRERLSVCIADIQGSFKQDTHQCCAILRVKSSQTIDPPVRRSSKFE